MSKEEYLQGMICNSLSPADILCGVFEHYVFAGSDTVKMTRDLCMISSAKDADAAIERVKNAVLILEKKGIA